LIFITIVKFIWKFCHFFELFFGLKEKKKTNLFERKTEIFFLFEFFDFFLIFLYMHETNAAK